MKTTKSEIKYIGPDNYFEESKTKEILIKLKDIEEDFDNYNGKNGMSVELCRFCKSRIHANFGIVHSINCPIIKLRELIWKLR